jgi:translation initiation factor IF-1
MGRGFWTKSALTRIGWRAVAEQGDVRRARGLVVEEMPNALYRVELASETRPRVVAHVAPESGLLRVLPGDEVLVELTALDQARARIVGRSR